MHKILVVDDDKKIVAALTLRLQDAGYEVVAAYDGTSAVEASARERFSLIVMDINLPFTNGVRAVASAGRRPSSRTRPSSSCRQQVATCATGHFARAAGFFEAYERSRSGPHQDAPRAVKA
jgi:CheY-like chemotaxis protein